MKILYCVYDMGVGGGVERVTTLKANYLKEQGHDVHILTCWPMSSLPKYGLHPEISVEWIGEGVEYHLDFQEASLLRRCYNTVLKMCRHFSLMRRYLSKHKFDIVVTTQVYEMGFLPFIKDGSKKIAETHISKLMYQKQRQQRKDLATKLLIKLFVWRDAFFHRLFDAVGCLTEEDRQSRGCPSNMYVIPNPLSFVTDVPASCEGDIALAVGRHTEQKDFNAMVDIWAELVKDYPEWKLQIVGGGHLKSILAEKVNKLGLGGQVLLEDETSDPRPYYANASVFLMTSNFEGMPMTLLEAQSYGLPIVSYACPCGPRDIVVEGTGFLVAPGDKEGFVEKLSLLLKDVEMRKAMGHKAYEASKRFTVQSVMQQWEDLFRQLIQKREQTV